MFKDLFYRLNHINPNKPKTNYLKLAKTFVAIFILISITLKIIPILAQESDSQDEAINQQLSSWDEQALYWQEASTSISQENWTSNAFTSTSFAILQSQMGQIPTTQDIQQAIQQDGAYIPGGMLGTTNNLIAKTYTQPASGIQYLAQLKDNLLGVKPAYAQGIGFIGLEPLLPIWRGFRNIVYLLSTVFFVVLGIMVMFRLKINPQTILTVQNAVPQVITTLLLVTFSYAIAGLLIDLTYLIQNIVLVLLFSIQGKSLGDSLFTTGINQHLSSAFNFKNISDASLGDIFKLTSMALPANLIFILGTILGVMVGGVIGLFAGPLTLGTLPIPAIAVGALTGGVIFIIILNIIILIALFSFFFGLVKAYVNIIFKIILAPLEIGLGAIPGMKIGFSSWSNNLFANLLIFPICLLFLVLANIIIEKTNTYALFGNGGDLWAPDMVKYNIPGTIANIAGASGGLIPVAIGFVTILLMGKLPTIIPQVFFAIKPSGLESAVGLGVKNITSFPFKAIETGAAANKGIQSYFELKGHKDEFDQWTTGLRAAKSTPPTTATPSPGPSTKPKSRKNTVNTTTTPLPTTTKSP